MNTFKKNLEVDQSLNLYRIAVLMGRTTFVERILTESQTSFCTRGHMEKET
jgi:hypothetical protein